MRIGAATPLMAAGLESLAAVELRNAVAAQFGVQLPATVAFDYPTLSALADFVSERLPMTTAPDMPVGEEILHRLPDKERCCISISKPQCMLREMLEG